MTNNFLSATPPDNSPGNNAPDSARSDSNPTRVALYARVSTKDQGQDAEVQLLQLRRYVAVRGWVVPQHPYIDKCSGRTPSRPALDRLVKDAKARRFDIVLVLRIDRIMRSVKHFINLNEVLELYGVKIVCAADGMDYSTTIGKLVRGILLQVAEYEVELLRERTKEGLEKARKDGKRLGRVPVDIPIEKVLELMQQDLSKGQICKMLHIKQSTLNKRLKERGLDHLVQKPTRASAGKGNEEN